MYLFVVNIKVCILIKQSSPADGSSPIFSLRQSSVWPRHVSQEAQRKLISWDRSKVWFSPSSTCRVSCFCSKIRENVGSYRVSRVITCPELPVLAVTRTGGYVAKGSWTETALLSFFPARGGLSEAERLIWGFFFFNKAERLDTNGQRGQTTVHSFLSPPLCMCVCAQPCIREGGLSDGGPIRSSGVLCIVTAASGYVMCVCVCVWLWVCVLWLCE